MILNLQLSSKNLQQVIEKQTIFDDQKILPHLSKILQIVKTQNITNLDLVQLSNIVKQTQIKINQQSNHSNNNGNNRIQYNIKQNQQSKKENFQVNNFIKQAEKLQIAGISLGENINQKIYSQLVGLIKQKSLVNGRFWGKIMGTQRDYYIIQGYKEPPKQHLTLDLGSQKPGEGVNYYTYFVTNDIFSSKWQELPQITIQQLRNARQIKKMFTGFLDSTIVSFPVFNGLQRHYLKAQIVRMTHSLQLSPKGVYKVNDDNPKIIEYEQQVKVPDFSQLSTLEGWVHKNQMILTLGRCTHFVDPSLPEADIETETARLAEQDPQIQRLRGITEDKPAQIQEGGLESFWIQKVVGNNQVFPKDQAQNVYAVTTLKNVLWPGWMTIGYANGYSNFYLGTGLKATQPSWNTFSNPNLQQQSEQIKQFDEPNPKQLPKIEQPQNDQNVQNQQQAQDQ